MLDDDTHESVELERHVIRKCVTNDSLEGAVQQFSRILDFFIGVGDETEQGLEYEVEDLDGRLLKKFADVVQRLDSSVLNLLVGLGKALHYWPDDTLDKPPGFIGIVLQTLSDPSQCLQPTPFAVSVLAANEPLAELADDALYMDGISPLDTLSDDDFELLACSLSLFGIPTSLSRYFSNRFLSTLEGSYSVLAIIVIINAVGKLLGEGSSILAHSSRDCESEAAAMQRYQRDVRIEGLDEYQGSGKGG